MNILILFTLNRNQPTGIDKKNCTTILFFHKPCWSFFYYFLYLIYQIYLIFIPETMLLFHNFYYWCYINFIFRTQYNTIFRLQMSQYYVDCVTLFRSLHNFLNCNLIRQKKVLQTSCLLFLQLLSEVFEKIRETTML